MANHFFIRTSLLIITRSQSTNPATGFEPVTLSITNQWDLGPKSSFAMVRAREGELTPLIRLNRTQKGHTDPTPMKRARDSEEQIIAVLPEGLKACSNDLDVSGHALTETLSLSADYHNALITIGGA